MRAIFRLPGPVLFEDRHSDAPSSTDCEHNAPLGDPTANGIDDSLLTNLHGYLGGGKLMAAPTLFAYGQTRAIAMSTARL